MDLLHPLPHSLLGKKDLVYTDGKIPPNIYLTIDHPLVFLHAKISRL